MDFCQGLRLGQETSLKDLNRRLLIPFTKCLDTNFIIRQLLQLLVYFHLPNVELVFDLRELFNHECSDGRAPVRGKQPNFQVT